MFGIRFNLLAVLLCTICTSEPAIAQGCHPMKRIDGSRAPTTGSLRAAVVFVDFPDFPATGSTQELYSTLDNATELYKTMSYGKLDLQMKPQLDKFYRMPQPSSSYNYTRGLSTEDHVRYVNDALKAVGNTVSFKGIDVLYILPPKGAKEISFSPTLMVPVTAGDGTAIGNSVTFGQDMYDRWGFKTVNHETGHTMGLPDLYPYSGGTTTQWVGGFDMMGLISGQSPDYFAILKWQLDWIDDNQVDCRNQSGTTTHRISPIEVQAGSKKAVMIPMNQTRSILVEVRSTLGINKDACGTGALIYEVFADIETGNGPIRVVDSTPGSGGCDPSIGGDLNDAPYKVGSTFNRSGISIAIKEKVGQDYLVEIRR